MASTILIVEDDPSILRGLELNLQLEGFHVITATDGRQALAVADTADLVVLDLMLPHLNGFEVCRYLRKNGNHVPIILLSAKSSEVDIVRGLDLGADDYVTKPFRVAELLARINAHLRRQGKARVVKFGAAEIDLDKRRVRLENQTVELSPREYEVLAFLVENQGRAVTRDSILTNVWGAGYLGTDRTVDNFIQKLRTRFESAGEAKYILTVRGVGYRFVAEGA